jgi:hypothetical protein
MEITKIEDRLHVVSEEDKALLSSIGTAIRSYFEWHMEGCPIDNNQARIEKDWLTAENEINAELIKAKRDDVSDILKIMLNYKRSFTG